MFLIVIFLELIINGKSDWVEIPQLISSKPTLTEQSSIFPNNKEITSTTPSSYEILMKTTALTSPTNISLTSNPTTLSPADYQTDYSTNNQRVEINDENETDEDNKFDYDYEDNKEKNNQYNSFLSFLNSIQTNLIKPNLKTVQSKILILKNLRDDLLIDIDKRMTKLFKAEPSNREARSHHEDHHDVEFPSNEGALMTIGFLTFAVFLIKLVLKLVYALKHKNTNNGTVMTATTYIGRKKRDLVNENDAKILQMIEEFNFKN